MVMVKPALAYLDVIARAARRVRRPGRGVPRERRVRDGEGRGAERLDRRRRRRARACSRRSSAPAPTSCSPTSRASSPSASRELQPAEATCSRARWRASPAVSTRRCGRSRRSAAIRSSSRAAEGAYLVDTDGNRYLDYVQSWGASILGHAHPAVVEAVQRAAADGTSFGAPTDARGRAGRGDRRARPVGREGAARVVGHRGGDDRGAPRPRRHRPREDPEVRRLLPRPPRLAARRRRAAASPRSASPARPASPRAPSPTPSSSPTTTSPRSTPRSTELRRRPRGRARGAGRRQHGPGPAGDGFLERLRDRCTAAGALLVFDEVITGFRLGPAGAQGRYGITPDLSIFGKVVGGGLPLAAVGGRADVMDHLAPLGPVYQAGTLSGNPLATAAGLAVLAELDDESYAELEAKATRFAEGLREGPAADAQVHPSAAPSPACSSQTDPVHELRAGPAADTRATRGSSTTCSTRGLFLAPSGYETLFVSPRAHGRRARRHHRRGSELRDGRVAPISGAPPAGVCRRHCLNAGWGAGERRVEPGLLRVVVLRQTVRRTRSM